MRESFDQRAERLGVEKPELERRRREVDGSIIEELTPESEQAYAKYIRMVGLAAIKSSE